jgi:hypothetical protein
VVTQIDQVVGFLEQKFEIQVLLIFQIMEHSSDITVVQEEAIISNEVSLSSMIVISIHFDLIEKDDVDL